MVNVFFIDKFVCFYLFYNSDGLFFFVLNKDGKDGTEKGGVLGKVDLEIRARIRKRFEIRRVLLEYFCSNYKSFKCEIVNLCILFFG